MATEVTDPDEYARLYGLDVQVYAGWGDYRPKDLISADTKCDVKMLCDISHVGVRYASDSLYAL